MGLGKSFQKCSAGVIQKWWFIRPVVLRCPIPFKINLPVRNTRIQGSARKEHKYVPFTTVSLLGHIFFHDPFSNHEDVLKHYFLMIQALASYRGPSHHLPHFPTEERESAHGNCLHPPADPKTAIKSAGAMAHWAEGSMVGAQARVVRLSLILLNM
jgi:hypothetical protein